MKREWVSFQRVADEHNKAILLQWHGPQHKVTALVGVFKLFLFLGISAAFPWETWYWRKRSRQVT